MNPELINKALLTFLTSYGVSPQFALVLKSLILLVILTTLAYIANVVAKKIILNVIKHFVVKSKNKYDDIFMKERVFDMLSHLAPAIVIYLLIPFIAKDFYVDIVRKLTYIYIIFVIFRVLNKTVSSFHEIYKMLPISKNGSIQGYLQVVNIFLGAFAVILTLSIILGKSPTTLLTGLGAMTALLILIFKDTILGFVAGIQLAANKMVKPGDWITVPGKNADGDVLEITLTTVKVQNFDKTVTTIPTYSLVHDAFTNWTGMKVAGCRRIKRAIKIDMHTVKFCTPEMLAKFTQIKLLSSYISEKQIEINNDNKQCGAKQLADLRQFTNLGLFRIYLKKYLENKTGNFENKNHDAMVFSGSFAKGMTLLVRQLPPTETGIPIELYTFAATTIWEKYEVIQADLFDHILAIIPEFELQIFQSPSGNDFRTLN